jgi:hypothetical protein
MTPQTPPSFDWIEAAEAAGTWAIAILAIWGDWIRGALFKPALRLNLVSPTGEFVRQSIVVGQQLVVMDSRYFHLRATNSRSTIARDVQILLTAIDIRGPDGEPQRHWTGAVPLTWQHPQLHGVSRVVSRNAEANADLFFVRSDMLQLLPMLVPNNLSANFRGETHFWITAIARGSECESMPLRLKVDWDGNWDTADSEMAKHLMIAPI